MEKCATCKGGKVMIDTLDTATATTRALLSYLRQHYGAQLDSLDGPPIWVNLSPDPTL